MKITACMLQSTSMSHTDKYNIKKEGEKKTIHSIESPFSPAKIKARSWEMLKGAFLQQI